MVVPMSIPTNSVGGFPFLHILSSIYWRFFDDGYSDWCEVILHCSLVCISLMISDSWASFHVPLGHLYKCLFRSSAQYFWLDCLFLSFLICISSHAAPSLTRCPTSSLLPWPWATWCCWHRWSSGLCPTTAACWKQGERKRWLTSLHNDVRFYPWQRQNTQTPVAAAYTSVHFICLRCRESLHGHGPYSVLCPVFFLCCPTSGLSVEPWNSFFLTRSLPLEYWWGCPAACPLSFPTLTANSVTFGLKLNGRRRSFCLLNSQIHLLSRKYSVLSLLKENLINHSVYITSLLPMKSDSERKNTFNHCVHLNEFQSTFGSYL